MFHRKKSVIWFLLPGFTGLMLFYIVPFFGGIYYSMTDGTISNSFVGADNYLRIWQNEVFRLGLKNTLELSLICAPLIFVMSFALAAMLRTLRDQSLPYRNVLVMPYLMPTSALLLIWLLLFDYGGVINRAVVSLGFSRILWLESATLRTPIVLMYIWKNVGFSVVIFSAALQAIPEAYYEFASLEGANPLQREIKITLPQILPTAYLVFVLAWVNAFKIFKEIYFIGGAYPHDAVYTLQHYMNNKFAALDYQDVTTAAYSFAVIVLLLFGAMYMSKKVRSNDV